jgi:hypothetical protein
MSSEEPCCSESFDIRLSYVGPVYTLSDTCNNAIVILRDGILGPPFILCEKPEADHSHTETVDDLMKLACALTKRRATSKSKNGAPFKCAITNGQTRW